MPNQGQLNYSTGLELALGSVVPSVAGPKRPQDRIERPSLKRTFRELLEKPVAESGYGKSKMDLIKAIHVRTNVPAIIEADHTYGHRKLSVEPSESEMRDQHPAPDEVQMLPATAFPQIDATIGHGSVLIAAIT